MTQYKTIAIKPATYEELRQRGIKGETWDQLLRRLALSSGVNTDKELSRHE